MSIKRLDSGPRFSQAVVANGLVFLAGQVAADTSVDTAAQTKQVLAAIDALLVRTGSQKSKIISATIYLADIADFAAMNQAWDAWLDPQAKPARATVQAALVTPAHRVEIQIVAAAD
jgi:enamine deaminase RidA (YjgF/YER057c/UK114 family)